MALILQLAQHLGHQDQLTARLGHGFDLEKSIWRNGSLFGSCRHQVWMVSNLLELHHDVEERRLSAGLGSERLEVVSQDVLVELSLQRSQVGSHDELRLGWHALEHVGLHTAQHVRS